MIEIFEIISKLLHAMICRILISKQQFMEGLILLTEIAIKHTFLHTRSNVMKRAFQLFKRSGKFVREGTFLIIDATF